MTLDAAEPRPGRRTLVAGLVLVAVSLLVYWLSNRGFNAGRGDLFYLADAFLHGRTWIPNALGPWDVIVRDGKVYVPFGPFPAIVLAPIVAVLGAAGADHVQSGINATLAAIVVGLAWWTAGRLGVTRLWDRLALALLLGFSTQVWWVTTRGGVWHTGHLIAIILTLLLIVELFGRARPVLLGLLIGAAFLTRAPVAFAAPAVALWLLPVGAAEGSVGLAGSTIAARLRALPWRAWVLLGMGLAPSILFFLWYNAVRFGSPFESGYALATLPDWLEVLRKQGMFSAVHVPMNFDYLFLHLPAFTAAFPWYHPDGFGMSVFITSPALLLAWRAPWRDRRSRLLLAAAVLVLIPTLLYYGGGWLQYGYRYFLDSIPFIWALVAMGIVRRGRIGAGGWQLIAFGMLVGLGGVYWAYHL